MVGSLNAGFVLNVLDHSKNLVGPSDSIFLRGLQDSKFLMGLRFETQELLLRWSSNLVPERCF